MNVSFESLSEPAFGQPAVASAAELETAEPQATAKPDYYVRSDGTIGMQIIMDITWE